MLGLLDLSYRKFKKLVNKYFIVEKESYFHKGQVYFVTDFAYVKFDEPRFLYSVRFEIRYHRKTKKWSISPNSHTATHPSILNSRDKFENIISDIYKKVGDEKNYWIRNFRNEVSGDVQSWL